MEKSIRVSEEFYEFVKTHRRDDETMEDTLRRLIGGPHPKEVAGIFSSETTEEIRERIEEKSETERKSKRELRERFK